MLLFFYMFNLSMVTCVIGVLGCEYYEMVKSYRDIDQQQNFHSFQPMK